MDFVISIFVAFLILICILPIGIAVQRLVLCAFKCLENDDKFNRNWRKIGAEESVCE